MFINIKIFLQKKSFPNPFETNMNTANTFLKTWHVF